jgi:hypothetical protein
VRRLKPSNSLLFKMMAMMLRNGNCFWNSLFWIPKCQSSLNGSLATLDFLVNLRLSESDSTTISIRKMWSQDWNRRSILRELSDEKSTAVSESQLVKVSSWMKATEAGISVQKSWLQDWNPRSILTWLTAQKITFLSELQSAKVFGLIISTEAWISIRKSRRKDRKPERVLRKTCKRSVVAMGERGWTESSEGGWHQSFYRYHSDWDWDWEGLLDAHARTIRN